MSPSGFRITYDQGQFKRLKDKLSPAETKRVVYQTTDQVAELLLEKISTYPPEKRVTRMEAFGQTWQSQKQRRWFFAALRSGAIQVPYQRTGRLAAGWHIIQQGLSRTLTNDVPYVGWVQEQSTQSRMMKIIGWRTVTSFLRQYKSQIGRVGLVNVRRWARR